MRFDEIDLNTASGPGIVATLVLVGLLTEGTPRFDNPSDDVVYASELVPFQDLFALDDTLVLDPSVFLGDIFFIDVDTDGSILVTEFQSELAHLFAPTGSIRRATTWIHAIQVTLGIVRGPRVLPTMTGSY